MDVGDDGPLLPLACDVNNILSVQSPRGPLAHQKHVKMLQRTLPLSSGLKPVYRPAVGLLSL